MCEGGQWLNGRGFLYDNLSSKILTVLPFWRLTDKWSLMLPNVISFYESESALSTLTYSSRVTTTHCTSKPSLIKVQSAKYIGITITENMDWGQNISDISSKATKTSKVFFAGTWLLHLGVLRRLHTKLWHTLKPLTGVCSTYLEPIL